MRQLTPDNGVAWPLLAFDAFIVSYGVKYEKAADCLSKDRDTLLAFYDFPAEHWKHLRTTNPIESTFATARSDRRAAYPTGPRSPWSFKLLEGLFYQESPGDKPPIC